ncbi:MAG TPA: efflux RND transporter permease subunit, partial [Gemmatimonadales bacterium]|nr:efflux RND transporter permease subunit [Gemmatimonadales bacterium]
MISAHFARNAKEPVLLAAGIDPSLAKFRSPAEIHSGCDTHSIYVRCGTLIDSIGGPRAVVPARTSRIISFDHIGVDRFPDIDFPMISVRTILPGASPEIIDSSISNLIETTVNSVPGIEHIRSTSAPGVSVVLVRFGLGKDVDIGFNEVQAKINQVLPRLPKEADPPVVAKVEFGSMPVMWLALTGDRTLQQLH